MPKVISRTTDDKGFTVEVVEYEDGIRMTERYKDEVAYLDKEDWDMLTSNVGQGMKHLMTHWPWEENEEE